MREEDLFAAAAALPDGERAAYLAEACGDDLALREGVELLLEVHVAEWTPVDEPVGNPEEFSTFFRESDLAPTEPAFAPAEGGTIKFGNYVLEDEIARGAMGVVYRAEDTRLQRTVALKMIRSAMLAGEEEVTRFHTEAEAAASLDHPNIAPIYEVGEYDDQHYFTMKLIEGGTLVTAMESLRTDPRGAAKLMATVARAIHAAHQRGILHRDIKPGNILLDKEGEPHVTDFGLAKQLESASSITLSGQILGTPYYMAPEQAEGVKELTTAADVYALGGVLYHLLTGRPPHKGESIVDTIKMVMDEEPARPRALNPAIDRDLETIVLKSLEKSPERRYASAAGLANDLEFWLCGEPVMARPVGSAERLAKWARRRPVHAAAWTLAALFLLTLGIGGPVVAVRQAKLRKDTDTQRTLAVAAGEKEAEARALADRRAEENRRNLYFAEMNLASQFGTNTGGIRRLRALTEKWIPKEGENDLRGWEWSYLNSLHRYDLLSSARFEGSGVESVAWSGGGNRIASTTRSGLMRVWRADSAEDMLEADDHAALDALALVAWSPDDSALASADRKGRMVVRDAETGKIRWSMTTSLAEGITCLAWRPNGKNIAFGSHNGLVQIRNAETGKMIQRLSGGEEPVASISWGSVRRLATGYGETNARIWESPPGRILLEPVGEVPIRQVSWSPDGKRLAGESLDGNDLLILEPGSTEPSLRLLGHHAFVSDVAWNPDGTRLASASSDRSVRIWDAAAGKAEIEIPVRPSISGLDWAPDGERIAFGDWDRVRVCDVGNTVTQAVQVTDHRGEHVYWSPDGTQFATPGRDGTVRIWEASTLTTSSVLRGDGGPFYNLSWNPVRNLLAAGGAESIVWDLATGEERYRVTAPEGRTGLVRWSPDGERLAVLENRRDIRIRDAKSGEEIAFLSGEEFDLKGIELMEWSRDGTRLAANVFHAGVRIWDTSDFTLAATLIEEEHVYGGLAWSPDRTQLAIGTLEGAIRILDAATGATLVEMLGHERAVTELVWSPDGTRLASGGLDRTIRLWDAATGAQCLALLAYDEPVVGLAWSPDGLRLVSRGRDGGIKVWEGGGGEWEEAKSR